MGSAAHVASRACSECACIVEMLGCLSEGVLRLRRRCSGQRQRNTRSGQLNSIAVDTAQNQKTARDQVNMRSTYALISPARNEAGRIQFTLQSVVAQTCRPERWIIVDDGSTDNTFEIVQRYAQQHEFIALVRAERGPELGFGSKAKAFQTGYNLLGKTQYSFIGNLDADVSFAPDYFQLLLSRFEAEAKLGLGGGIILEDINNHFVAQRISENSVAGAVQLFRRECYERIGGYLPMRYGGIDSVAEIMVRMHG